MAGPLSDIKVIDFSRQIAGPYATQMLGDLGAEIIVIETPEAGEREQGESVGPNYKGQGYHYLAFNRNKKSVVLDLTTPSGKKAFYDLAKVADVVCDNFRAGVMERLGADYETLKKVNPRIITCSITGWGTSGPNAHRPSTDVMMQGHCGLLSITGEPGGKPTKPGEAVSDSVSGIFAATGIITALYKRAVTGEGCKVDVSMLAATMALMNYSFQYYFCSGVVPQPVGSGHLTLVPWGAHKTRNGYIILQGASPKFFRLIGAEWMAEDPRFKEAGPRLEHKEEFTRELEEVLSQKDTEEWLKIFHAEDINCGSINTIDKVVEDAQVKHEGIIIELESQLGGIHNFIGCPIKMAGLSPEGYTAPPLHGQHTEEVLSKILGYSGEQISKIQKEAEEHTQERQKHVLKRRV